MSELAEYLARQNPHWSGLPLETGISRPFYLEKIQRYLSVGEILVLNGVRRAGKTTLLWQTIRSLLGQGRDPRSILFVNCDEPAILHCADPLGDVLATYQREIYGGDDVVLVFDEIQEISGWEHWVKAWYDRKKFRIILSGSSAKLLDSGISRRISGRYLKVPVYPLDFAEYLSFFGEQVPSDVVDAGLRKYRIFELLRSYLQFGGFPAAARIADEQIRTEHLSTYFESILFRDIEEQHDIRNPTVLRKLLAYAAANISVPYSYRALANVFGSDPRIITDYLTFAEDAFLFFTVSQFSYSLKSQAVNGKKLYMIDTGLRNAVAFRFSSDQGRLVENAVYVHLRRYGYVPYFWKGTGEVDFLIMHRDSSFTAINVCYSDDMPEREVRGLSECSQILSGEVRRMILITKDLEREENGVMFVPLWKWLLANPCMV